MQKWRIVHDERDIRRNYGGKDHKREGYMERQSTITQTAMLDVKKTFGQLHWKSSGLGFFASV